MHRVHSFEHVDSELDRFVELHTRPDGSVPFADNWRNLDPRLKRRARSIVVAIIATGPRRFAIGPNWQPMSGSLAGSYEIRFVGPWRTHHRIFCLIERLETSEPAEGLVLLYGAEKPNATLFAASVYGFVAELIQERLDTRS